MAADLQELEKLIAAALPGAEVEVVDEGGGDHLRAIVTAAQFEDLTRIDQHRLVRAAVRHDPCAFDHHGHSRPGLRNRFHNPAPTRTVLRAGTKEKPRICR